jgi:tetratricopeptide (TPR) repeat protein
MSAVTPDLKRSIENANAAYDRRDWAEAERLCRAVLATQPQAFDALHLMGIIAAQGQRLQDASQFLGQAVAARPDSASAHANLGNVLVQLKRFDEAVAIYDRALKLRPGNAMACSNRGVALNALGRFDAAVASFDQAIVLKPDFAEAHYNRGNALFALHQYEAALASYERALALKPSHAEAHFKRGDALLALKQYGASVASYERAIALRPDFAEAHANLGNALCGSGRYDAALAGYERAIALKPGFAEGHYNRAIALVALRQLDAAIESYDRAIAIKPDYADAHWNKSHALLLGGDFSNGWALFEWRWRRDAQRSSARRFAQPLWLGEESISGKTILLHAEQGMGDTIQFCRYAKLVADMGARVILEAPKPLCSLLATLDGVSQVVETGSALPPFDYHCPLMSLPLALKTEVSSIPAPTAYLRPDAAKSLRWKEKLGERNKLRVGLVWSGGFRRHDPDTWDVNFRRNIDLARLAPLKNERIEYYSLQKGEPAELDLARLQAQGWDGPQIADYAGELHDFSDTAALIDNLDLVISVDTSIAHLAGALGKPVWILNRLDTCWRWFLDRDDSPWYPTVKLYRQEQPGDWDAVVERVRADLERLSA